VIKMPKIKVGNKLMEYGKYCEEVKPKWKEQMAKEWRREYESHHNTK